MEEFDRQIELERKLGEINAELNKLKTKKLLVEEELKALSVQNAAMMQTDSLMYSGLEVVKTKGRERTIVSEHLDVSRLPQKYQNKPKTVYTPNKKALKKAFKSGRLVEELGEELSMFITVEKQPDTITFRFPKE